MLCAGHAFTAKRVDAIHDHKVAGRPQCRVTLYDNKGGEAFMSVRVRASRQRLSKPFSSALWFGEKKKQDKGCGGRGGCRPPVLYKVLCSCNANCPLSMYSIENVHILGFGTWFDRPGALRKKRKLFAFALECDLICLVEELCLQGKV